LGEVQLNVNLQCDLKQMKRFFVAIPISDGLRNLSTQVMEQIKPMPGLSFTSLSNLHITACFLGNFEESKIIELNNKLCLVSETMLPLELNLKGLTLAPPDKNHYMVWINFEPTHCFNRLCATLDRFLLNKSPQKEYLPHITLARFKNVQPDISDIILDKEHTEIVSKIVLYESDLRDEGPIYTAINEFGK